MANPNAKRLVIPTGADATLVFRLMNKKTGDPVNLSTMSKIKLELPGRDRSVLAFVNAQIPAIKAEAVYKDLKFKAVAPGAMGNLIQIVFNNERTVTEAVEAWNSANPDKQVEVTGTNLERIFPVGVVSLEGGYNSYKQVSAYGDPVLGKIQLILTQADLTKLRIGNNQSMKIYIDFAPGSPRRAGSFQNLIDIIN